VVVEGDNNIQQIYVHTLTVHEKYFLRYEELTTNTPEETIGASGRLSWRFPYSKTFNLEFRTTLINYRFVETKLRFTTNFPEGYSDDYVPPVPLLATVTENSDFERFHLRRKFNNKNRNRRRKRRIRERKILSYIFRDLKSEKIWETFGQI
jgi:hypothetical protein